MGICYIVVDGMFNEGYQINKVFSSFNKAEKYIIGGNVTYIKNYKRESNNRWVNGCGFIEIEEREIYFWDSEDVIMGNRYGLIGFLLKSVKDIVFEGNKIDIIFATNSILIELID